MDGFTAAKDRAAAGQSVERELLEGLALAVIAGTGEGRIALAVLRAGSDAKCLSRALDLTDAVLQGPVDASLKNAPPDPR